MYAGVDIGGTKTIIATIDDSGTITEQVKIPTSKHYDEFVHELRKAVDSLSVDDFQAAGIGVPGLLDREHGIVLGLGNLPWKNEHIQADCEKIFNCPVVIENDANLAALSEAMLHKEADTVLYVTVSTGIGSGVVYKQRLDEALLDSDCGHMLLPHHGKLERWEDFASGRAIVERFGKKAAEISDEATWHRIAHDLSLGLFEHIAIVQPDLIIIGGSVGTYFNKFGVFLAEELKKYEFPIIPIPPIIQAQRPEEAVVFGCYDLAKQNFPIHGSVAQPA